MTGPLIFTLPTITKCAEKDLQGFSLKMTLEWQMETLICKILLPNLFTKHCIDSLYFISPQPPNHLIVTVLVAC